MPTGEVVPRLVRGHDRPVLVEVATCSCRLSIRAWKNRDARVEPEAGAIGDERVVVEALVVERVLNDHRLLGVGDHVAAEGDLPVDGVSVQPYAGLVPLAVLVHERDQRHGDLAKRGGESREVVEGVLGKACRESRRSPGP